MLIWKLPLAAAVVAIACGTLQDEAAASQGVGTTPELTIGEPAQFDLAYGDGHLSAQLDSVALNTVLIRISKISGVTFEIKDTELKRDPITIKLDPQPLSEAVAAILADYNTFFVWDEELNLLNVKILGRSGSRAGASSRGTITKGNGETGLTQAGGPAGPDDIGRIVDGAGEERINRALEDLATSEPHRRFAAVGELVGVDDPRIAHAILDVALSATVPSTNAAEGEVGEFPHPIHIEAALALWRHGIERGFADNETIDALETLRDQGDRSTSGIARKALDNMTKNF